MPINWAQISNFKTPIRFLSLFRPHFCVFRSISDKFSPYCSRFVHFSVNFRPFSAFKRHVFCLQNAVSLRQGNFQINPSLNQQFCFENKGEFQNEPPLKISGIRPVLVRKTDAM